MHSLLGPDRDDQRGLGPSDARAIVAIATLAADIDRQHGNAEVALLAPLTAELCARADISPSTLLSTSPIPSDDAERNARIRELTCQLTDPRSRALAYAVAYLVAVADFELAPIESMFLDQLRRALDLDNDRAAELAESAAETLTPGIAPIAEARTS